MENKDRDKMNKNTTTPTPEGDVHRDTPSRQGQVKNEKNEIIEKNKNFGPNSGRPENLENEPNRRTGMNEEKIDISRQPDKARGLDSGNEH